MKAFGIISIILASLFTVIEVISCAKRGESDMLFSLCYLACAICLTVIA